MAHHRMAQQINDAKDSEDFFAILYELESGSPLAGAAAECPFFVMMPPTLHRRELWPNLLKELYLDSTLVETLTSSGFMPFDRELFLKKSLTDLFEALQLDATHTLIDLDYGILLCPHGTAIGNYPLDRGLLQRLQAVSPFFVQSPASVLAVGPIRAHYALHRTVPSVPEAIEFEVSSRAELDQIIQRITDSCREFPLQLWYRGQSRDYALADLRAYEAVCPWRNVIDSSLVPSLYRQAWDGRTDLSDYCSKLHTIQEYVLFMKSHLAMQPYTTRSEDGEACEKLSDAWGAYAGGMSVTEADQDGRPVATRDYHPAFNGMQQAFFLQHYGLPSNILDLTHSVDVALFFAQNEVTGDSRMARVDFSSKTPLIYIFFLLPGMDRFIDSQALSEHYRLERPLRQKCGLLCGASYINRNYYARFVGVKIHLKSPIEFNSMLTPQFMFPDRETDSFLNALLTFQRERGLTAVSPFELQA